jgi:hypothetical protein
MRRWMAMALVAATIAGLLPSLALAGSGGRRNTALGLTGGALFTWFNGGFHHAGTRNTALALTAASAVAWHQYNQSRHSERRRAQLAAYRAAHYSARPVTYVAGYRQSYTRPVSYARSSRTYRARSSQRATPRYCQAAYSRGYRAGYNAGYNAGLHAPV